jgi:hypothetical protein
MCWTRIQHSDGIKKRGRISRPLHHQTIVTGLDNNSIKRKRDQINLRKFEETIVYSLEWYSPSTLLKNFLEQLEHLKLEQSVPPTTKSLFFYHIRLVELQQVVPSKQKKSRC